MGLGTVHISMLDRENRVTGPEIPAWQEVEIAIEYCDLGDLANRNFPSIKLSLFPQTFLLRSRGIYYLIQERIHGHRIQRLKTKSKLLK